MYCILCDNWLPPEIDGGVFLLTPSLIPICHGCHGTIVSMGAWGRMEILPVPAAGDQEKPREIGR